MTNPYVVPDPPPNRILTNTIQQQKEVLLIGNDGRIWWNGVEVVTEQEFREAMIELHHHFCGVKPEGLFSPRRLRYQESQHPFRYRNWFCP